MDLIISTRDTDGCAHDMKRWANVHHPQLRVKIEPDSPATYVVDDNGNFPVEYEHIWEDFCNADHNSY